MKRCIYIFLILALAINTTYAEASTGGRLSFGISSIGEAVSGFVKSTREAMNDVLDGGQAGIKESVEMDSGSETVNKTVTAGEEKPLNTCEIYDQTFLNIIDLDVVSSKATERIDKIEEVIEEEASIRADIFEKNKKLTELQKKEKMIFGEIKKEIDGAKKFYGQINTIVVDTTDLLVATDCDTVSKRSEQVLRDVNTKTGDLIIEEVTFRKIFTSSLKDKMTILQDKIKDAKNAEK